MRFLPNSTNGVVVLSDSFTTAISNQIFLRVFNKDDRGHLSMGLMQLSMLKSVFFFPFNHPYIWELMNCDIDHKRTEYLVLSGSYFCWKEVRLHRRDWNCIRYTLRVTTIARHFAEAGSRHDHVTASFDQEAAVVLMSCIAVFKAEIDNSPDVLRWLLDRILILLRQNFADYRKEDPNQLQIDR